MTTRVFRLERKGRDGLWRSDATYSTLERAIAAHAEFEVVNPYWAKNYEWRVVDRRYSRTVWPNNNEEQ